MALHWSYFLDLVAVCFGRRKRRSSLSFNPASTLNKLEERLAASQQKTKRSGVCCPLRTVAGPGVGTARMGQPRGDITADPKKRGGGRPCSHMFNELVPDSLLDPGG